jgi:hypothetical protein
MAAWMLPAAIFGSSLLGANAASKAADTQAGAADRAAELQYKMYQENVQRQQPFLEAGVGALNKLTAAVDYTPFGTKQFQADPGYAFRLSEGQQALDRSAAARGGLISGGALKAATRYGQDMGSQEYQNAFNRYQTERASMLNPLQSLAGVGQTTANTLGNAGQSYGTNAGEAYMGGANARASGYVGGANAFTGGLGSYLNYSQGQDYLNRLRPPGGGSSLMSEPYAGYNASIGLRS